MALGTRANALLAPLRDGGWFAAKKSLARAGRVHEYRVKERGIGLGDSLRVRVRHHGVRHAHALEIPREDDRTARDIFIGHEHPAPREAVRYLGGFPPGRGAEVKHSLLGLDFETDDGEHGGRLLHIERPRVVQRVPPDRPRGEVVETILRERCRAHRVSQQRGEVLARNLREPRMKSSRRRHVIRREKAGIVLPEQSFHAREKRLWQHGIPSFLFLHISIVRDKSKVFSTRNHI